MRQPDDLVAGDIVVREFNQTYLIWLVRDQTQRSMFAPTHERLGETDDRDQAISRARKHVGSGHAVWFCHKHEEYRRLSTEVGPTPGEAQRTRSPP